MKRYKLPKHNNMDSSNETNRPEKDYAIFLIHDLSLEQLVQLKDSLISSGISSKSTGIWSINKWIEYRESLSC